MVLVLSLAKAAAWAMLSVGRLLDFAAVWTQSARYCGAQLVCMRCIIIISLYMLNSISNGRGAGVMWSLRWRLRTSHTIITTIIDLRHCKDSLSKLFVCCSVEVQRWSRLCSGEKSQPTSCSPPVNSTPWEGELWWWSLLLLLLSLSSLSSSLSLWFLFYAV